MTEKECKNKETTPSQPGLDQEDDCWQIEEINLEEVAIDGICGVY